MATSGGGGHPAGRCLWRLQTGFMIRGDLKASNVRPVLEPCPPRLL